MRKELQDAEGRPTHSSTPRPTHLTRASTPSPTRIAPRTIPPKLYDIPRLLTPWAWEKDLLEAEAIAKKQYQIRSTVLYPKAHTNGFKKKKLTIDINTSVVVDRSRGEKLTVHLNVTFPRVPCCLLSLNLIAITRELQRDITRSVVKTRLTAAGTAVPGSQIGQLRNDIDNLNKQRTSGYCGLCYGEEPGGCESLIDGWPTRPASSPGPNFGHAQRSSHIPSST
ncbi:hypothetical protein BJV78DRAFT_1244350, partial [Lactifluus subvellereus]